MIEKIFVSVSRVSGPFHEIVFLYPAALVNRTSFSRYSQLDGHPVA